MAQGSPLVVRGTDFSVAVDEQPPKTFPEPIVNPAPRLYLGDGFEVEHLKSNSGSEFLMELSSLRSELSPP